MSVARYDLQFPGDLTDEQVVTFARSLSVRRRQGFFGSADPVVFEVVSRGGSLTWALEVNEREGSTVLANLRAAVPSLRLVPASPDLLT